MEFLTRIWETYPLAVDFGLYFLLFAAVARAAFAKQFPSYEGRMLSVAVGLFMAAGLALAQKKLGFSVQSMGPVAIFFIALVVFIAGYRFLQQSGLPKHMTIFFCCLFVFVLLRVTMPDMTNKFIHDNSGTLFLAAVIALIWAWYTTYGQVKRAELQKPGHPLERFHLLPGQGLLRKEKNIVKKNLRNASREDEHAERAIASNLRHALELLDKQGLNQHTRRKILSIIDSALQKCDQIREHGKKLLRIDDALKRFDVAWFHRMHAINFGRLTPEQQKLLQDAIIEERRRIHVEEELEKLELETDLHIRNLGDHMRKCRSAVASGDAAAASGWITEAIKEEERSQELERAMLDWEQRLLSFVKRQREELLRSE
ncbi:MAG: hypothetical protein NTU83_05955 [Candidatus Hydrogenedentes bacterium]|nr:hypothetical protein [Candidatus Hydrogenedentota bacterium]